MGVVGLSGGGPYALACGAVPPVSGRVAAVGVLGGVVPSFGFDAAATGVIDMTRRFAPLLSGLRRPLATMVAGLVLPVIPFGRYAYRGYASIMPKGDQKVFADSEMEGMFLDDLALLAKGRFQAFVDDIRLFGRDWGFRLADVKVPVRWWHGDADPIVPRAPPRRRPRTCPTPNSSCAPKRAISAASPPPTRSCTISARSSKPDPCGAFRPAVRRAKRRRDRGRVAGNRDESHQRHRSVVPPSGSLGRRTEVGDSLT
jgi:pimeloyl-ACP methyl ester carboxylesterase